MDKWTGAICAAILVSAFCMYQVWPELAPVWVLGGIGGCICWISDVIEKRWEDG